MKLPLLVVIAIIAIVVIGGAVYLLLIWPSTQRAKVLKIGTSPDFPPFEYIDETTGEVVGIDIDLIKAIAKKLGYEIEIVQIEFAGLIEALEKGHIDVAISGITITEERSKKVDFSIPYWKSDQAILVTKVSSFKPQNLTDLAGKIVGVQSGTTAEILLDELKASNVVVEIKRYSSYSLAVQDLVNGRVDAVLVDSPVASTLAKNYGVEVACIVPTGEEYGIAVKKGNTELLKQINRALEEILNSEEWQRIISKYLG
ncbi:MAG: basic amino acid ABC transporter substrate-binding protein [Ignisphaera sp.]|uniref:Basic amino acid ABC transporter substrate-binding protein n=1 Tax=Ignisphaera aggregans TaxID=334771 RepID=A0A7C4JK77_9CREN